MRTSRSSLLSTSNVCTTRRVRLFSTQPVACPLCSPSTTRSCWTRHDGSSKTLIAASKSAPCLRRFNFSLRGSQLKFMQLQSCRYDGKQGEWVGQCHVSEAIHAHPMRHGAPARLFALHKLEQLGQSMGKSLVSLMSIVPALPLLLMSPAAASPWYATPEGWLFILGVPTLFFVGWQAQATARAARATEASVEAGRDTSKRQLRAYLAVIIGGAIHQERREKPKSDLMFEASPLLVNTGQTPAHKIRFKARAAIYPIPLPKDLNLPETGDAGIGETVLGVGQNGSMSAMVEGFCQDDEVEAIKGGSGAKGLYVWGIVHYEDVFGESHYTRFCQHIYWDGLNNIRGHYIPGRNEST